MNTTVNIKELCKHIRKNKGRNWIWQRQEKQHFITNRHFLVRFDEVPNEVLAVMFSIFFKVPAVGETLVSHGGQLIENNNPLSFDKIYQPTEQDVTGEATPFMKDLGYKLINRIIKFPSHYSLIDEEYFKFAEESPEARTKGTNPDVAVYFADGDLLILPYRLSNQMNNELSKFMEGMV